MIQRVCNQKMLGHDAPQRDGFESLLISKVSLFTFPTAAGQINRLERGECLYTYKNSGPVGRNLGESY